jgi:phage shock protein C
MQVNPRRLYRSRDRQLAGVAGGMGEYLDIDPTVIRIGWIIVTLFTGGLAIIAYIVLALVIPQSPYAAWSGAYGPAQGQAAPGGQGANPGYAPGYAPGFAPAYATQPVRRETRGLGAAGIVGIVLVVIGVIALADVTLPGIRAGMILGPAVILALGAALLVASVRRPVQPTPVAGATIASPDGAASFDPSATAGSTAYAYGAPAAPAWPDAPDLSRPAPAATQAVAWDATDTQPVDPTVFDPAAAAATPEAGTDGDPDRVA